MKKSLLPIVIAFILMIAGTPATYAGFVMPTHSETAAVPPPAASTKEKIAEKRHTMIALIKDRVKSAIPHGHSEHEGAKKVSWQPFVSFGCSLLGFFLMIGGLAALGSAIDASAAVYGSFSLLIAGILLGIAGVVFGIISVKHRKNRFRGFALAGMILGYIDIFFLAIITAVAVATF